MAKTKTPFLSLGARGSVGESITAQKHHASTILREKPLPTDPYSLPQAYQRWLYDDYAYLWTCQSATVKSTYRASGVRFHLTGFQYWMKYHLKNLPDIVGMWHLDEKAGATAKDFSRNDNDATIFGASPSEGLIAGGQFFDGLNDYIATPANLVNAPLGASPRTMECFTRCDNISIPLHLLGYGVYTPGNYCALSTNWHAPFGALFFSGHSFNYESSLIIIEGQWHYACLQIIDSTHVLLQLDETEEAGVVGGALNTLASPFYISSRQGVAVWWKGTADHVIIWDRLLDKTERDRHAARRYSL